MADIPSYLKDTPLDPDWKARQPTPTPAVGSDAPDYIQALPVVKPSIAASIKAQPKANFSNVDGAVDQIHKSRGTAGDFLRDSGQLIRESFQLQNLIDRRSDNIAKQHGFLNSDNQPVVLPGIGVVNAPPDISTTNKVKLAQDIENDSKAIAATQARVDALRDRLGTSHFYDVGRVAPGVGGAGAQPSQVIPIIGGVVGSSLGPEGTVAGAAVGSLFSAKRAGINAYAQAIDMGASDSEAKQYAAMLSGVNFAFNTAGAALEAKALGVAKKAPADFAKKWLTESIAKRLGKAEIVSNAQAQIQQGTEFGLKHAISFDDPEAERRYQEQLAYEKEHYGEHAADNFANTTIVTGVLSGPIAAGARSFELGQKRAQAQMNAEFGQMNDKYRASREKAQQNTPSAEEVKQAQVDKAYEQNSQPDAEQQRADQMEADFRNQEIQRNAGKGGLAGQFADKFRWTPEMIAQERVRNEAAAKAQADAEAAARTKAADEARTEEIGSVVEKQKAAAAKKAAAAERAQRVQQAAAEKVRLNKAVEQSLAEQPLATKEQHAARVKEILDQQKTAELTKRQAADANAGLKIKKPAPTVEAKPSTTADENITPAPSEEAGPTTDTGLRELARKRGMNVPDANRPYGSMDENKKTPSSNKTNYADTRKRVVDAMLKGNTRPDAAALELTAQQKLVLADTPEAHGFEDNGQAAHYDPKTGKTFIFMNKIKSGQEHSAIAEGLRAKIAHESTHAGLFNDRVGRSKPMQVLMGDKGLTEGVELIMKAKDAGNAVAKKAVARAIAGENTVRKNAGEAPLDNTASEADLHRLGAEIMGYFAEEATSGKQLGRLAGLKSKIVGAGRAYARKSFGVDLPVTIDDIAHAARGAAEELVHTNTKGRGGDSKPFNTIIPEDVAESKPATKYKDRLYRDRVDGQTKFVISDKDSHVTDNPEKLRNAIDNDVNISTIYGHKELYDLVPLVKQTTVTQLPEGYDDGNTLGAAWVDKDTGLPKIAIHPDLLESAANGDAEDRRQVHQLIAHELQHVVQRMSDGASEGSEPAIFINDEGRIVQFAHKQAGDRMSDLGKALDIELGNNYNGRPFADSALLTAQDVLQKSSATPKQKELARQILDMHKQREEYAAELDTHLRGAQADYLNTHGEREARWTAANIDKSLDELPADPTAISEELGGLPGRNPRAVVVKGAKLQHRGVHPDFKATAAADQRAADRARLDELLGNDKPFNSVDENVDRPLNSVDDEETPAPKRQLSQKEEARRIVDHAVRGQTADLQIAENLEARYRAALSDDKVDPTDPHFRQVMDEAMTSLKNADPAQKEKMWDSVEQEYPHLGPVFREWRDLITDRSLTLFDKVLSSGVELSADEIRSMAAIAAHETNYLTRAFSAFQGRAGKAWAKQRYADYNKLRSKIGDIAEQAESEGLESLTPQKISALYVDRAIKDIERAFGIPDDKVLDKMGLADLKDLYEAHIDNPEIVEATLDDADRRAEFIKRLQSERDALTPEQRENFAEDTMKQLLGVSNAKGPTARSISKLARDPGTLLKRSKLTPAIRQALGEITDPGGRALATVATQSALIARYSTYADVINNHYGDMVVSSADRNKLPASERDKFNHHLTSDTYGPLTGKWVTDDTFARIGDMDKVYHTWQQALVQSQADAGPLVSKALKFTTGTLGRANRAYKYGTVILNLPGYPLNYVGSYLSLLSNGNVRVLHPFRYAKNIWNSHVLAQKYALSGITKGTTPDLNNLYRFVNLESADVAGMQRILGDSLKHYLDGNIGGEAIVDKLKAGVRKGLGPVAKGAEYANTFAVREYAMLDGWSKIANFFDRLDVLGEYYEALGVERTPEQLMREAGDTTSYTNISTERVLPVIRGLENSGLTSFAPYFSEVVRTGYTNYVQGIRDFQAARDAYKSGNTKAATVMWGAASRRIMGNTLAIFGTPIRMSKAVNSALSILGASAFALASGSDEDNKKRRLLGDIDRSADILNLGSLKDGRLTYLNISGRVDPNGPITDIMRSINTAPTSDEAVKNAWDAITNFYIMPAYLKRILDVATEPDRVFDPRAERIAPEKYKALRNALFNDFHIGTQTTDKAAYVLEGLMPKPYTASDPKYSVQDKDLPESMSPAQKNAVKMLVSMGAPIHTLDIPKQVQFASYDSNAAYSKASKTFNDLVNESDNATASDLETWVAQYALHYGIQFNKDYQLVESMRAWGMKDDEIVSTLKGAGYSKDLSNRLVANDRTVPIKTSSLKKSMQSISQGADETEKQEKSVQLQSSIEQLQNMSERLKKYNVEVK